MAVRKGSAFEDYITFTGRNASGKPATTSVVVYGTKICTRASGARSYTCRTMSNQFFATDPTTAFAAGAGSTTFERASAKTVGGQLCDGYSYTNKSQTATATGVVYISTKTNLPCEQDATVTRQATAGGGTFAQKSTTVWSRFNDKRLTVPAIPTA